MHMLPRRLASISAHRTARTYLSQTLLSARAMSSTVPKRQQFLVYAPDKTDDGAFERRLSVRDKVSKFEYNVLVVLALTDDVQQHLGAAAPLHDNGTLS